MKSFSRFLPAVYVLLLTVAIAAGFFFSRPGPSDDHYLYQQFIEELASGRLNLAIAGFHGTDVFGFFAFLLYPSRLAQIYGLIGASLLLPLCAYLAGKALFRTTWHGLMLATIVTMMPFISFVCLRGWTGPGYWVWMLLALWTAARKSQWTGAFFALAILTKPFAVALLLLLFVLMRDAPPKKLHPRDIPEFLMPFAKHWWFFGAFLIVSAYLGLQLLQAGRIFVGAHPDLTAVSAFQGPMRIILNLAHSLQILFSVHNYYYPVPALTGAGNMLHTTPVLIFLGIFGIFASRDYWPKSSWPIALFTGATMGILMNSLLDHMDHFYMEASVLLLILAALPVLKRHPLWTPVVIATLHFQWLYFYLQNRTGFSLSWGFFVAPLIVDVVVSIWWCSGFIERWRRGTKATSPVLR